MNRSGDDQASSSSESSSSESEDESIQEDIKPNILETIIRKTAVVLNLKKSETPTIKTIIVNKKKSHREHRHHHERKIESENERKRALELSEVSEMLSRGPLRNKDQVLEFNR